MKLKKLEILGFKSFAQKAVLEFPDNICAIVGPNGSGKSNVADAIRWVLGEQGQKQIRIDVPTDVIFAGSPGHGRMAISSVKVEFDDPENIFGLEASQVVFERKLSRDGIGEFLINKSQSRLKDIILYLTKAKAGVKGISVVNQGAVDNILLASSRERYEMILETLGLKELEIKKNDSLKKLEDTKTNLKEVKVRKEEIAPHLKLLKREKEKAVTRNELGEKLRSLEIKFFSAKFKETEENKKTFISEKEKIGKIVSDLRQDLINKELELASAKKKEDGGLGDAERELLQEKESLIYQISRIEAEIKYGATVKVINYKEKLDNLIRELEALVNIESIGEIKDKLSKILESFKEALSEKQSEQKTALNEEKEEIVGKIKEIEARLQELKNKPREENVFQKVFDEYKNLQDKISEAKAKLNSVDYHLEKLRENEIHLEDLLRASPVLLNREGVNEVDAGKIEPLELSSLEREINRLRIEFQNLGETDREVLQEAEKTIERYEFLERETQDLKKASRDLLKLITELDNRIRKSFKESLVLISEEFNNYMRAIFGGGYGKIYVKKIFEEEEEDKVEVEESVESELDNGTELVKKRNKANEDEMAQEVIEIDVSLPNKKIKSIESLSGGERALTSIAILFALVKVSQPPFLILDEVDAALDEANALKFIRILKELNSKTQFILITHNRLTIEAAQILYGVTMQAGVSKVISLKLSEAEELAQQDE